jgi:hypothetical protein
MLVFGIFILRIGLLLTIPASAAPSTLPAD